MIYKRPAPYEGKLLVTFELPGCIWTAQVNLVGDFNHWDPAAHPMRQKRGGDWTITLELEANRSYEFRYLLDNREWVNDDHADDYVLHPQYVVNSVVNCALEIVPRQEVSITPITSPCCMPLTKPRLRDEGLAK
jgi:hypothetical protein